MNKEELIAQANEMPLGDLAEQVIRTGYPVGIHDTILIERCRALDSRTSTDDLCEGLAKAIRGSYVSAGEHSGISEAGETAIAQALIALVNGIVAELKP